MFLKITRWFLRGAILEILAEIQSVKSVLLSILKEIRLMTASVQQLHDALTAQGEILNAFITDVQALLGKVTVPPDVQADLDKVNATIEALQAADAAVKAAISPGDQDTLPAGPGTDTPPADAGQDTPEGDAGTDASIPQE